MNTPTRSRRPAGRRWSSRLMLAACGVIATFGLAQPTTAPATGPAEPAPDAAPVPPPQPRWGGRRPPPPWRLLRLRDIAGLAAPEQPDANAAPVDDEEWQRISEFAQENFPNRWKRFTEIQASRAGQTDNNDGRPEPNIVDHLKQRIVNRYRVLKRLENEMPDLYATALNQGKLEDEAWGASVEARRHPKDQKLQAAMREKVAALVKDVLNERQKRLNDLQQAIKAQQEDLDRDKQDIDSLIDTQMNRLTGDDPGDFWRRGRGGG